jgi:hypothetical protein
MALLATFLGTALAVVLLPLVAPRLRAALGKLGRLEEA